METNFNVNKVGEIGCVGWGAAGGRSGPNSATLLNCFSIQYIRTCCFLAE